MTEALLFIRKLVTEPRVPMNSCTEAKNGNKKVKKGLTF